MLGDPAQFGRIAFQLLLLLAQRRHPVHHRDPIQFGVVGEHAQLRQRPPPRLQLVAGGGDPAALGGERVQPLLQARRLLQQCIDLGLVGPAEHIASTVVDALLVVLLVPLVRLDLAGTGDRLGRAPELRHRGDALVRGADPQLPVEPVEQRGALDLQLGVEGIRADHRRGPVRYPARHPVVHQPAAEVVLVDPVGHGRVVLVGHQHADPEAVQQPFRSALPLRFLRSHGDQLTGERQLFGIDAQFGAQGGPECQVPPRNVAGACGQAA
jgi:hypothetical protein